MPTEEEYRLNTILGNLLFIFPFSINWLPAIERTENLLPQIKDGKEFDYDNAAYGLKKIIWGYFKK